MCALILIPPPKLSNGASRCDKPAPKTKPIRPPVQSEPLLQLKIVT